MPLASRMKDRIAIDQYDDAREDWFPRAEMWAEVVSLGQEQYRVAIRWRPDLRSAADVEPTARVRWPVDPPNRILDILDVTETVPRVEVQLLAKGRQIDYDNLATGAKRKTSWP
jgi:hypothetical protein